MGRSTRPYALRAALNSVAASEEAKLFVDGFVSGLEKHETDTGFRKTKRRHKGRLKIENAFAAFICDLLVSAGMPETDGWVYRSMTEGTFSGERVGYKTFKRLVTMMEELRFIEPHEENETVGPGQRMAAHWKPTGATLGLASARGITPTNVLEHFAQALPQKPVKVRAASQGRGASKVRGKAMRPSSGEALAEAEHNMNRLNTFLDGFIIEGASHRGYERIFNEGDHNSFYMDRGGRLYSRCHNSYQSKSKAERGQMRINGEGVAEIDVRSSFMVILHGLAGEPFDPSQDCYDLTGYTPPNLKSVPPRSLVKGLAVCTIGYGKHWRCWPRALASTYYNETGRKLGRDFPIGLVRLALISRNPILGDFWSKGFSWSTLMFRESEAILGAMLMLMDEHKAPSLSVHDSLIVRASDVGIAKAALVESYRQQCGLEPFID